MPGLTDDFSSGLEEGTGLIWLKGGLGGDGLTPQEPGAMITEDSSDMITEIGQLMITETA